MLSLVQVFVILFTSASSLPQKWPVCPKDSPNYSKCIQDAVNFAVKDLVSGIEQYGIPPIDPLSALDYSVVSPSGPVSVSASFKNTLITGFKDSHVENIATDWKTMNITVKAKMVSLTCDCSLNGRLLAIPVTGSGKLEGSFDRPTFKFFMTLSEKQIDGKTHYHVDDCIFKLVESMAMNLKVGNLFSKHKEFSEKLDKTINDNFGLLINEIRTPLQEGIGRNAKMYANTVFDRFPKDEISPP